MSDEKKWRFNPNIFDNHEIEWVVNTSDLKHLIFAQKYKDDGKWQSNGFMRITMYNGTLIIAHDYGDAVYHWGGNINFEFVAGCDLYYFREKCQASEMGRFFEEWDYEIALEKVEWMIMNAVGEWFNDLPYSELLNEEHNGLDFDKIDEVTRNLYKAKYLKDKNVEYEYECMKGASHDEFEFYSFLRENDSDANKLIGGEWTERIGNMKVPAVRCEIHLLAMKKIWEILEKEEKQQAFDSAQADKSKLEEVTA